MQSNNGYDPRLEFSLYAIVFIIGLACLIVGNYQTANYWQSLLLNLGSSMVIVTIVFLIFRVFGMKDTNSSEGTIQLESEIATKIDGISSAVGPIDKDFVQLKNVTDNLNVKVEALAVTVMGIDDRITKLHEFSMITQRDIIYHLAGMRSPVRKEIDESDLPDIVTSDEGTTDKTK